MKKIYLLLIIPFLFLESCCFFDNASVTITGSAGTLSSGTLSKGQSLTEATQIGVFKVIDNSVSVDTVMDAEYVPIDSSGDFEINLTKQDDTNYILMLFGDDIYDIDNQFFLSFLVTTQGLKKNLDKKCKFL